MLFGTLALTVGPRMLFSSNVYPAVLVVHGAIPCTRELILGVASCAPMSAIEWWPLRLHFNWLWSDFGHPIVGSGKRFPERVSLFFSFHDNDTSPHTS